MKGFCACAELRGGGGGAPCRATGGFVDGFRKQATAASMRRSASWAILRRSASRSGGVPISSHDPEIPNPVNDKQTDPEDETEADGSDMSFVDGPVSGLTAKVLKYNHRLLWDKRWVQLHESFMVLLVYKTHLDFERKTPQHIYLLGELRSAKFVKGSSSAIELHFNEDAVTGIPVRYQLTYAFAKPDIAERWLESCRRAASAAAHARAQKGGCTYARGVSVKLPSNASGHGMTFRNLDDQPVGVAVTSMSQGSPVSELGIDVHDVILAVNEVVCLSHSHAHQLLQDVDRRFELIVCSRSTQRQRMMMDANDEAIDISEAAS